MKTITKNYSVYTMEGEDSEESFIEACESNAYTFLEDGTMFND